MNKITLLNFLTVLRCPACDEIFKLGKEGKGVLCEECRSKLETEKERCCVYCGLPPMLCRCVPKNIKSAGCQSLIKIWFYDPDNEGVTEKIILNQKDYINKRLSRYIAEQLALPIRTCLINAKINISDVMLTYAPRSKKAVNEKGFDQAEILAKLCAEKLGCRFLKLITRTSFAKQQKELDVSERTENAKRSFKLKNMVFNEKTTVVVIDDIVTSGASLSACVNLLKKAGVENVISAAVAQTNKKRQSKTKK